MNWTNNVQNNKKTKNIRQLDVYWSKTRPVWVFQLRENILLYNFELYQQQYRTNRKKRILASKLCVDDNLPWSPFLESPENFSGPESHSKISNLTITKLFYTHIFNMNRGSIHTRSFRRIHFSVFRYRWTKNGFTGPKSFQGFRETGPRSFRCSNVGKKSQYSCYVDQRLIERLNPYWSRFVNNYYGIVFTMPITVDIICVIKSSLKSLVTLAIWLTLSGAIYSRIALFFAINPIFFLANENGTVKQNNQLGFKVSLK